MDFSYISILDFLVFGILLIVNLAIFLLGFIVGKIKMILLFCIAFILFLALPFLNVFIVDNYINKVSLELTSAKKLVYSDSFFIAGKITNQGKQDLNKCNLYIYISSLYPLQKPEFLINLENLNLTRGNSIDFSEIIDNFKFDDKYKKISIRCFK